MTRRLKSIGLLTLLISIFCSSCVDYPDRGPLLIGITWEIPPSEASDPPDRESSNTEEFGDCEEAGVRRFDYQLEDMSDCYRNQRGWSCRIVEDGERIDCDETMEIDFGTIDGGDYALNIWGFDADGYETWSTSCEDLYVNGSTTPSYECDIRYFPQDKAE